MRLPPLNSLRAFEAAARHCSVGKAAKELHVTPAAISHQIRALEEHVGVQLFRRLPRRIELTPAGEACLPKLTAGFAQLAEGIMAIDELRRGNKVVVTVPPALGTRWLVSKLPSFTSAYPEVDLRIAARQTMVDRTRADERSSILEDSDIAIRMGDGDYPDMVVHKLFSPYSIPMCSPKLRDEGPHPLRNPDDLRYHTLLHYQSDVASLDVGRPTWSNWLRAAGVRNVITGRGVTFNHVVPAMQAAADGLGVILGIPILAVADVESGRLVTPFSLSLPTGSTYYAVHRPSVDSNPAIVAFRDWLLAEARRERWAIPPDARE